MRSLKFFVVIVLCFFATACGQQKKYITYTVKKGETIKSIARKLDMRTKDLLRLNPDVGRRPSPNTTIIIPNKTFKEDSEKSIIEKKDSIVDKDSISIVKPAELFVTHLIKKGDTFYKLTRFYNVTEKELYDLNPNLLEKGLQVDEEIIIKPKKDENMESILYQDTILKTDVSIAMLLPFRAVEYDTIEGKDIFKTNTLANITTDLYLGADIAMDSLSKQGLTVDLKLFDTGRKNQKIDSLLSSTRFNDYDAIIGPLYSDEVPKVANRTSTPVVFPVYSRNQNKFNFSRIVKTYPDKDLHQTELLSEIIENYQNENLLIVGDSSDVSINKAVHIQSILLQQDSIQEAKIIHPSNGYIPKHIVINALKAEVGNWVVLATDNSVIASDVINSLISLPQEEEEDEEDEKNGNKEKKKEKNDEPEMQILPEDTVIRVFAFDKSNKFDKIDNNKLAKLGFTFTSDVYVDENSSAIASFNKQYQEKNHTFPSYYATKGFDIVYDIAIRLASGDRLKQTFRDGVSVRLESKFDYSKKLYQTSSNKGVFILQYNPDMTLRRIK